MSNFTKEELEEAQRAINSLTSKCEKALKKLVKGTSQQTLLKNRIKALRIASSVIKKTLQKVGNTTPMSPALSESQEEQS
jgi:hypothetical protein